MSEIEDGAGEATITTVQVDQAQKARDHLAEVARNLALAEAFIAQSVEHVIAAMIAWDTAGEVDSGERNRLSEVDYDICRLRDHVRDMLIRYVPLAYGRTEGDNKDLADGHRWGRG